MKLAVISNPAALNNEHEIVSSLFDLGLTYFHLRKPSFSPIELENYIRLIPQKHHDKIIVHSHFQLAAKYDLKGIHVSPLLYTEENVNKKYKHISTSFHSVDEIKNCKVKYDYAFLSPIFNSISKPGYQAAFESDELKSFLKKNRSAIFALGGIDVDSISEVKEMGFDGAAVLGSIWLNEKPVEKYLQLQNACLKNETLKKEYYG